MGNAPFAGLLGAVGNLLLQAAHRGARIAFGIIETDEVDRGIRLLLQMADVDQHPAGAGKGEQGVRLTAGDPAVVTDFGGFLRRLFISCRDNIATARLVFGEGAGSTGPYQEICDTVISRFISLIIAVLEKGKARGILQVEDTELAATMIFGLFQRSMFYFLLTKKEFDVDRIERGMTAFLFRGVDFQF